MATHILISVNIFILFLISANGRALHKPENLHFFSSSKLKAISHASSDSYITNYNDVLGLGVLLNQYPFLQIYTWNADPCAAPVWDWIECNTDSTPRVIALNLHNVFLYDIPNDFTALDALQRIDFSQTSMTGTIPSFLGTFPDLQELNLANNLLYGAVPASLCNNKKLKLTLFGNTDLSSCSSKSTNKSPSPTTDLNLGGGSSSRSGNVNQVPSKKKSNMPIILGVTIPALLVLFAGVGGFAIHSHRAKTAAAVAEASASTSAAAVPAGVAAADPNANIPLAMEEVPMHPRHNPQN